MQTNHDENIDCLSMQYWVDEAWFTRNKEDKVLMYKLAARAAEKFDPYHATVLRRISKFYEKGAK